MTYKGYEAVIGLEMHVELKTAEKAFCRCSAAFGGDVNSKCCPVCLGMPGALPVINPETVRLAVRAGLALGCKISTLSRFDRKHYFYPDLPKGYQITQYYEPICLDGKVVVRVDGEERSVGIERIHMEEDAGKLTYEGDNLFIDHNRCGVPLIEIVTRPDIRSAEEAMAVVNEIRRTLLFAGVSDCRMNEGSLRCDVNISVRPEGSERFGDRCEIKNINSIGFIGRAIENEMKRQVDLLLSGGKVVVETRRFSEDTGRTERMRDKETSADYRYIRDPDLPPVITDGEYVEEVRRELPMLPAEREKLLCKAGVKEQQAYLICSEPAYAEYFDRVAVCGCDVPAAANMFVAEIIPAMGEGSVASPEVLAECVDMYVGGEVNIVSARSLLKICAAEGVSPREAAESRDMFMICDEDKIAALVKEAADACPGAVREIMRGKITAKKVIVGQVMKLSRGRAEPRRVNEAVDRYFE